MQASKIEGEWMQVRYATPPAQPMLSCGDEESDFQWTTGWIRWLDGEKVLIREEHHYGC